MKTSFVARIVKAVNEGHNYACNGRSYYINNRTGAIICIKIGSTGQRMTMDTGDNAINHNYSYDFESRLWI